MLRIGPSQIHGVGIFAVRFIEKDEKLFANALPVMYHFPLKDFKALSAATQSLLLERWPQIAVGSAFLFPDALMQAYINHSDNPNYDSKNDMALRNIQRGEEVTENYRKIDGHQQAFPWLGKAGEA